MAESLNMKRWSIGVMEYWEPIAPILHHCSQETARPAMTFAIGRMKTGVRGDAFFSLAPENFIDINYLKERDQGGFIKKLYGE
jgi:hypothetical protein